MTNLLPERPSWEAWALGIAYALGPGPTGRADCTRRKVGAVIVEESGHRIIGAGYNGGPSGGKSCLKGECPRGRHFRYGASGSWRKRGDPLEQCFCGKPWPCDEAVEPGSSYDTGPGACVAVHAEMNALLDVWDKARLAGAAMYVTDEPCDGCRKHLANTPLRAVVWPGGRIEL